MKTQSFYRFNDFFSESINKMLAYIITDYIKFVKKKIRGEINE